ncbi:MAG: hypothetical protein QM778_05055 [Myxococcales bacterium]
MRFFLGFLTASVIWGALATLAYLGVLPFPSAEPPEEEVVAAVEPGVEEVDPSGKGKRRKPRRARAAGSTAGGRDRSGDQTEGQVGDDLDWDGTRQVDMGAGEEQLSGKEIESGFDSVMNRIRRCLILVPADGEIKGQLLFGMRVGGDGKPRAVQLTGPSVVISGESGSCLREAAQGIRFATFDGPEMLFKYPVTLQ